MPEDLSKANHDTIPISRLVVPTKPQSRKLNLKIKNKMSYLWKKILAPAIALVRSAIPYSQLSFFDWTLRPTLVVVLSLIPPSSPSPRVLSSSTPESVLSSVALLRRVLSYTTIPFSRKWHPDILPPSCSFSSLSLLLKPLIPFSGSCGIKPTSLKKNN